MRFTGMRKNSVASSAMFDSSMKSCLNGRLSAEPRLGDDLLAADKERGLHQVEAEPADPAQRQRPRDVGLLEKAVADRHGVEVLVEMVDFQPLRLRHPRHVLGAAPSSARCARAAPCCASCCAAAPRAHSRPAPSCRSPVPGTRAGRSGCSVSIRVASGSADARPLRREPRAPPHPGHHDDVHAVTPMASGNQPPSSIFSRLAPKNDRSTARNSVNSGISCHKRPARRPAGNR